MNVGIEWLVDAAGCSPGLLQSPEAIRSLCARILEDLDLKVVGEGRVHQFPPPGGITAMYLLTESHLTCHTYPESGAATFNLHCCRARPEWNWPERLRQSLGADQVTVRRIERGVPLAEAARFGTAGDPLADNRAVAEAARFGPASGPLAATASEVPP